MQMIKFKKYILLFGFLLLCVGLVGCGKQKVTTTDQSSSSSTSSSSQPTLKITFGHGKFEQAAGLLSVPIVMQNDGSNRTLIDSNNFSLHLGNRSIKPYQLDDEASDFHLNFSEGNIYQNTLTFKINQRLTKSQLKDLKLTYLTDKGTSVTAKKISKTVSLDDIRQNVDGYSPTDLGTYYKKAETYLKDADKEKKNDPNAQITSVEDEFEDKDYDKLRTWIAIPSTGNKGSNNIVLKVLNSTNTNFNIAYNDLELVDKSGNEIQVSPDYRNYVVNFPHGKYITVVIPMENTLKAKYGPYKLEVRADESGDSPTGEFFATKKSFNPAEVKFSNEVTDDTLFSLAPSDYPKDSIKWSNQQVDGNRGLITVDVKLSDYYNLDNQNANYQVIGFNDSGQKDIVNVSSVKPEFVATTKTTKIKMHVKKLQSLTNYQHIVVQSNGKSILTIK